MSISNGSMVYRLQIAYKTLNLFLHATETALATAPAPAFAVFVCIKFNTLYVEDDVYLP